MKSFTVVALMALSSVSALAQSDLDGSFPTDAGLELAEMHRLVAADFLDPNSAQYKGMSVAAIGTVRNLCGWVNARNSLGGYTPFYPFYVSLSDQTTNVGQEYRDPVLGDLTMLAFKYNGCAEALGID